MANDRLREQLDAQNEQAAFQSSQRSAMQAASKKQQEVLQNPNFLNELRDPDVDSDVFGWMEDEFPTWFSGAHIVGNRQKDYETYAELLMANKRERAFAEANPGRLIRNKPYLLAIEQDVDSPDSPHFREPMRSPERRVVYGASDVATNLMSLSVEGRGIDATSTATTESRVVKNDSEEGNKTVGKLSTIFE